MTSAERGRGLPIAGREVATLLTDRGEGVKNPKNGADVICEWSGRASVIDHCIVVTRKEEGRKRGFARAPTHQAATTIEGRKEGKRDIRFLRGSEGGGGIFIHFPCRTKKGEVRGRAK